MPDIRPLSARDIAAVQDSFARVAPQADALARDFYVRLFAANPEVRSLFPADMAPQRDKLVATLAYVVRGLHDFASIEKAVRDLGVRHRGYRAVPAHYKAVGIALLDSLGAVLGPRWTPELADAWKTVYKSLASTMIDAAAARGAA